MKPMNRSAYTARLSDHIAAIRAKMNSEEFKGWLARDEQGKHLPSHLSRARKRYREMHPYMRKSREVSIQRAFRSLWDRGFLNRVGRSGRGYEWRTIWHKAP